MSSEVGHVVCTSAGTLNDVVGLTQLVRTGKMRALAALHSSHVDIGSRLLKICMENIVLQFTFDYTERTRYRALHA